MGVAELCVHRGGVDPLQFVSQNTRLQPFRDYHCVQASDNLCSIVEEARPVAKHLALLTDDDGANHQGRTDAL